MERKTGPVYARACGAVLALLAGAIVQADSEDEITRCARSPSVGDRIICLEDALRRADEPQASSSDAAPGAREAGEFGLDEPQGKTESPESIRVTVVAIEKNAYGKARYSTEDGQIWQQIDQRTPRYPDVPFPAEIRTAAAGSYFLQPLSSGVAVRVQRKR